MTYKEFARLLKDKRIKKGYLQKDIAFELAIQKTRYNRIENGLLEPTFLELQKLCEILDIDLTILFQIKKPIEHQNYD